MRDDAMSNGHGEIVERRSEIGGWVRAWDGVVKRVMERAAATCVWGGFAIRP